MSLPNRPSPLRNARVLGRLRAARSLVIATDLDGTLVRLRRRPGQVRLPEAARRALRAWAATPRCAVVVLSGRALRDLKRLVAVREIGYIGNHGLEMVMGRRHWTHPAALRCRATIVDVARVTAAAIAQWPAAWVQDKRLTLSIHYRRVPMQDHATVLRRIRQATQPWVRRRIIRLMFGKQVVDVRPPVAWAKGHALQRWIAQRRLTPPVLPVILGDDRTDEDAFRHFPRALTVVVGEPRRTAARYSVRTPEDVVRVLRALQRVRACHA